MKHMLRPVAKQSFAGNVTGAHVSFQRSERESVWKRKATKGKGIVTMDGADDRSGETINDRRAVSSDPGMDLNPRRLQNQHSGCYF